MKKINLFGVVGFYSDITATAVADFLNTLEKNEEFEVYINSPGGDCFEGITIHNLLAEYQSRMTIKIIGEASSIASVIACAGAKGKVLIADNAMMLIHKPWSLAFVDEDYMQKLQKDLTAVKNAIIQTYINKTGKSSEDLNQLMTDAEYHNAEECVKLGLADTVYKPSQTELSIINSSQAFYQTLIRSVNIANKQKLIQLPTEETNYMFKDMNEAIAEYGKLQNQIENLNTTLSNQKSALEQSQALIADKESELKSLKSDLEKATGDFANLQKNASEMKEQIFVNEATLFCERMFAAKKISRAEINGNAKVDNGEMPAKVQKLVMLRKANEDLYNLEITEIENRTNTDMDYLSDNLSLPDEPGNNSIDDLTPNSFKNFIDSKNKQK